MSSSVALWQKQIPSYFQFDMRYKFVDYEFPLAAVKYYFVDLVDLMNSRYFYMVA